MIKLYHAAMTRSVRIIWLLEELGLPYELVKLDFFGGELKKPAYLSKNPLGKVPAIEDGDVLMFESGAIIEWLCEKYGNGRLAPAPGTAKRPQFLQWLHWAEATAMPPLGDFFQNSMVKPETERIPQVIPEALEKIDKWLAVLDNHLAGKRYLLGEEFSAADVMMGYTLGGVRFTGQLDARFPNVEAYNARLAERPAFQKANAA